jgi:hypothetical protein
MIFQEIGMKSKIASAAIGPVVCFSLLLAGCAGTAVVAQNGPLTATSQTAHSTTSEPSVLSTSEAPTLAAPAATAAPADAAPWDLPVNPPVADFTPAQLWAAYKADPVAADARYYGQTFVFKGVVIDEMAMLYKGMAEPSDAWVINAMVYFRTDNKSRIMNLKVGDIVEITGIITGPMQNYVLVDHCSYKLIDDTKGITRPNWIDIPGSSPDSI